MALCHDIRAIFSKSVSHVTYVTAPTRLKSRTEFSINSCNKQVNTLWSLPVTTHPVQWIFPLLKNTGMSSEQYEKLQTRLYSESVDLTGKFGVMFNAFFRSVRERDISVKDIVGNLKAFGAFTPVYKGEFNHY